MPAIAISRPPSPASRLLQGMRGRCGNDQRAGQCPLSAGGPRSHGPRGNAATDTPRPAQPHIQPVGADLPAIAISRPSSPASRLLQGMRGRWGNDQVQGNALSAGGAHSHGPRGNAATDTPRPAQPHTQPVGAGLPAITISRLSSPASRLLQGMRGRWGDDQRAGQCLLSATALWECSHGHSASRPATHSTCRSWLASDSNFKAAIAGKPAPTRDARALGDDQRAGRCLLSAGGCTNSCRGLALAVLWYTIIRTDTLTLHGARS